MPGYSLEVGIIVAINIALCLIVLLLVDGWQNDLACLIIGVGQAVVWKKIEHTS